MAAHRTRRRGAAGAIALMLFVTACTANHKGDDAVSTHTSTASGSSSMSQTASSSATAATTHAAAPPAVARAGEHFETVGLAQPYTPHADVGTDDYRCFLIDPHLLTDQFLTGVTFVPDQAAEVHHAILYRVEPGQVAAARAEDDKATGEGWSCFGGAGLSVGTPSGGASGVLAQLERAPWLSAWAPGGREQIYRAGLGVPMKAGTQIVLQVHYNLRAGTKADETSVRLRMAPGSASITPLQTMLLPGPVELACAPGETGALCDRNASIEDLTKRFGSSAALAVAGLQLLCGGNLLAPHANSTQTCTRTTTSAMTIQAAAGHMHLLGKSLRITLDPGTAHARVVLDIPVWDFDDQGARSLPSPIAVPAGSRVQVSCTHDASLRQKLPELRSLPARYVTWGDGTSDEMCLGVLLVTRP